MLMHSFSLVSASPLILFKHTVVVFLHNNIEAILSPIRKL